MTRDWNPEAPDEAVLAIARTAHLVVALDFDGTASELVPDPMSARAVPEMAAAVAHLAALDGTTVAFVSVSTALRTSGRSTLWACWDARNIWTTEVGNSLRLTDAVNGLTSTSALSVTERACAIALLSRTVAVDSARSVWSAALRGP